jgi:hypothetical protein
VSAPAGWYPDSTGTLRWWDGSRWTDAAPTVSPSAPPRVPENTSASTVWIWLIALMPVVTLSAGLLLVNQWLPGLLRVATITSTGGSPPDRRTAIVLEQQLLVFTPWYVSIILLSAVVYGLGVWFAYRDYRSLESRGFQNPFHWAWMFLSAWVYVIGRTVVVRHRGAHSTAPMAVFIAIQVIGFLAVVGWLVTFWIQLMQTVLSHLPAS